MAEKSTGGSADGGPSLYGFPTDTLSDMTQLPDYDTDFISPDDVDAFVQALAAPDPLQSPAATASVSPGDEGISRQSSTVATPATLTKRNSAMSSTDGASSTTGVDASFFITAKNDWAPIRERVEEADGNASASASGAAAPGSRRTAPFFSAASAWLPSFFTWKKTPSSAGTTQSGGGNSGVTSKRSRRQEQRRRAAAASTAAGKRSRKRSDKAGSSSLGRRTRDETREGYLYGLLKWPFLIGVFGWIIGLSIAYLLTRMYIAAYEQLITWRGRRQRLRHRMRATNNYADWVSAANALDAHLGNDRWKEENEFAFYDFRTVRRVADHLRKCRARAEAAEAAEAAEERPEDAATEGGDKKNNVSELKALVEACVKNNFAGIENRHLYSRTYYGTKNLVQSFVDEVERSLEFLIQTNQLDAAEKRALFKRLYANYGRTALCLSGGASFAYYHFGVVRALLDEDLLPNVITGTSGGALVAALVATRTNDELRQLLVPALAGKINACSEPFSVWFRRWWKTGARFDSVDWARQCAWWSHGSMTFREAYERTGRILNVTCVPADPHSPTILCNYRTAPDCVIWSAVLASAAVPGILNPVVLMMKTPGGRLVPYSFGHKWKDGSLRTDIPIKSLNLHFNVNFTIVSQVNPHVNLFFFSSRGSVGQPVTHRKGRGWRGGYLGSAFEEYLKQDLRKWLKLLRNLELLPRLLGQDWSELWLQPFSGTITIWPKSIPSDFVHLLSDPDPPRLARMLHEGRQSAFPPLKFVSNRLRIERLVERGRLETRLQAAGGTAAGAANTANAERSDRVGGVGDNSGRGRSRGLLHLGNLGGQGHTVSSSLDSLMSDDDTTSLTRLRRRRRDLASGIGLGLSGSLAGSGLGSTTATSDENNLTSDTDGDLDLSGGGIGIQNTLQDSYDDDEEPGHGVDFDDDVPIVEETEADE
ncbi:lipid acyl hydrolase [Sporothrix brasiliensis 5110]|uniref:Lipid acyl hydrolase n=1 Tax=Sporothrix brasiliensis 5110 TaxID=1398154 RepID=A0A0C2IV13_9PEZI|nr:lipid acyl hydrolase [Sporothrix brasiliensis 5110]KIH92991.1 lipid acyl hydrolase [Sporothrix brasiliensis 5110]